MTETIRFLMCSPDHYDVDYVINPWMEGNIHKSSQEKARQQWQAALSCSQRSGARGFSHTRKRLA